MMRNKEQVLKIGLLVSALMILIFSIVWDSSNPSVFGTKTFLAAGAALASVYIGFFISDLFTIPQMDASRDFVSSAIERLSNRGRSGSVSPFARNIHLFYVSADEGAPRYWQHVLIKVDVNLGFLGAIGQFRVSGNRTQLNLYDVDLIRMKSIDVIMTTQNEMAGNEKTGTNVIFHKSPDSDTHFGVAIHEDWNSVLRIDPVFVRSEPFRFRDGYATRKDRERFNGEKMNELDSFYLKFVSKSGRGFPKIDQLVLTANDQFASMNSQVGTQSKN